MSNFKVQTTPIVVEKVNCIKKIQKLTKIKSKGLSICITNPTKKMSVASSFPCIKVPACSSSPSCTSSSTSSFRFSSSKPHAAVSIRNSQTEGPLRRPVAPPVREPSSSVPQPLKPSPPSQVPPQKFQRQKAKELQEYFKQKKLEDANQGPFFGFIGKNEISNGR